MPPVRFAPGALQDLQRLREFLRPKSPGAARRAGQAIQQGIRVPSQQSRMGRTIEDMPEHFREWPIHFGDSGYVVRYRISPDGSVTILAIWHQREAATPSP
ncbi:MAG: type II toxin-antitoxin system RelE/ParE family toxin [Castellaniella sp.]|uniref:type II toxin-antitoxin system RelE/ParE family toxin n=1 Tax=Castellaniella sp. TaxID=1955812 RepID=UPI003C74B87A